MHALPFESLNDCLTFALPARLMVARPYNHLLLQIHLYIRVSLCKHFTVPQGCAPRGLSCCLPLSKASADAAASWWLMGLPAHRSSEAGQHWRL